MRETRRAVDVPASLAPSRGSRGGDVTGRESRARNKYDAVEEKNNTPAAAAAVARERGAGGRDGETARGRAPT
jgi:hypothetical protein